MKGRFRSAIIFLNVRVCSEAKALTSATAYYSGSSGSWNILASSVTHCCAVNNTQHGSTKGQQH